MTEPVEAFRSQQAFKIAGITYRQLDYWARQKIVVPSIVDAGGSGSQRLYSLDDIRKLRVMKSLLEAGVSLQKVRKAIEKLEGSGEIDWERTTLVASAEDVFLVTSDGDLVSLVREQGQTALNLLPLGPVRTAVADRVIELFPGGSGHASMPTRSHGIG